MKRRNAGEDGISRKSAKPSGPTAKPKASKAPKAQTECMTVWRHAGRHSASRVQGQPNVQYHTFDWDSQAGTNSASLAPAIAQSSTSQDSGVFDSGTDSIHSDHFALGPGYGQRGRPFDRTSSARSSRGVSRSSRPEICSTMTSDGMDGPDTDTSSSLPCAIPPLQRFHRITMHRSAPSSPFYDGQNPAFGLNNFSNPRVPHARPSLQRQRRITLHGDSTSPFSSNDPSWPQPSHFLPNNAGYSSMPAPPSLFAESFSPSMPSVSVFSSGSEYSAPDASLLSPPSTMQMPFPSIPQTSIVDVYDPTSFSMRSYSSHGPSLTMEMGQYCGSLAPTSPNQSISSPDNPWGIPAGSLSVMSSPNNPSLINPSDIATRQPTQGTRNNTEYDQLFLHDPRNTYSAGVNQVNYDISPYAGSPFSISSYTSENYTPYQMLLDYNPIPQTAPSLRYSPGPQNALQLEFSTATTDLPNADVLETGPLDPELLLMDFHVPQNTNEQ